MKLFILFESVPYEGGNILGVFTSKELAEQAKTKVFVEDLDFDEYYHIEEVCTDELIKIRV